MLTQEHPIIGKNGRDYSMNKPFTIKVNDLHQDIVKMLNEAQMPCYVLKTLLYDIIKEIEDADGAEITKYFEEIRKANEDTNGNMQENKKD